MTRERILLLDGQTTQALACARSLGRAGHGVLVASSYRRPLAAWSRYCEARYWLPAETVAAFGSLRAWARARAVTMVVPLTEGSHFVLNAERAAWVRAGIAVGCAEDDVLLRAFDKASALTVGARAGVAVPPTRIPRSLEECEEAAEAVGLPCIVKARFSVAWDGARFLRASGTSYARTLDELRKAVRRHRQGDRWPLVQRYVAGRGKGVFTVCDRGRAVAWFAHERLRDVRPTGSGSSLRRAVPVDSRLREPAARLLAAMGWHGPAMIEFRDDGVGAPWLMEVNGRFWGSLQLAVAAGIDFPGLWVDLVRGRSTDVPSSYDEGVALRWLWGDAKRLLNVLAGPSAGFPGRFPGRWEGLREIFGRQPPGTRSETWDASDPWPAVGEWVQGVAELIDHAGARAARRWSVVKDDSSASALRGDDEPGKGALAVATSSTSR